MTKDHPSSEEISLPAYTDACYGWRFLCAGQFLAVALAGEARCDTYKALFAAQMVLRNVAFGDVYASQWKKATRRVHSHSDPSYKFDACAVCGSFGGVAKWSWRPVNQQGPLVRMCVKCAKSCDGNLDEDDYDDDEY